MQMCGKTMAAGTAYYSTFLLWGPRRVESLLQILRAGRRQRSRFNPRPSIRCPYLILDMQLFTSYVRLLAYERHNSFSGIMSDEQVPINFSWLAGLR